PRDAESSQRCRAARWIFEDGSMPCGGRGERPGDSLRASHQPERRSRMPFARHVILNRCVVFGSAIALLALGRTAETVHAGIVVAYVQHANANPNGPFVATNDGASPGATTTFADDSVVIDIGTLGGITLSTPILAYITYENVHSVGQAFQLGTSVLQE